MLIIELSFHFKMKDLGPLTYFLGIAVHRLPHGLHLSQTKYALDLVEWTDILGCKPISSPTASAKLNCTISPLLSNPTRYRSIVFVGALQYLTLTRPDPSFVVNQVTEHMQSLAEDY